MYKKSGIRVLVAILIFFSSCNNPSGKEGETEERDSLETTVIEEPEEVKYGFSGKEFEFHENKVGRNQFLADILQQHQVPYAKVHEIATRARDIFDVRKIRAGNMYCILTSKDSVQSCQYFIYEKDPVNYVVFDLRDSVKVFEGQKEVVTRIKETSGVINSSLYLTLDEKDVSPVLAIKLSEVYAWAIDFYRIQKGDRFKVIYEEKIIDGEVIGTGRIIASVFNHFGKDYYGFYFEQGEDADYFDEEANSLRKAFLKAPLRFTRISSRYTGRRFHPVQKRWKAHLGTDYAAPTGTPIYSVGDGVITHASYTSGNGNYVKVRHNSVYTTQYLHMSKIHSGIRPGKTVKQGDVIGYVGSTGLATGPHLCFRFWKNGKQVDPFKQEIPSAEPIKKEYLEKYTAHYKEWKGKLDSIPYDDKQLSLK